MTHPFSRSLKILAAAALIGGLTGAPGPSSYRTDSDLLYRTDTEALTTYQRERCRLDVYYPEAEGFPTIVWFHGGGLTGGNRSVPEGLRDQGVAVVPVSYRLSPEVSCPAYLQDAAAAVAWTLRNISRYGGDPHKVYVAGHSAGGYLTSMVGLDQRWLDEQGLDADQIAGLIPLSGHTITHMTVRRERGIPDTQPVVDAFAPLYHVRSNAPPILLITGDRELEMLGRYEENAYFMRMLKVVGHADVVLFELDGYGHNMVEPALPLLLRWVRDHVGALPESRKRLP